MNADPETVVEAKAWFAKALNDLRAGEHETGASPSLNADIVFHAQQAAEKSMKGFLCYHGLTFRKTHNLVEIGEACAKVDATLEPLLRRAATLTEYAWKFRYPGDPEDPSDQETGEALALANAVFEALMSLLPFNADQGPTSD